MIIKKNKNERLMPSFNNDGQSKYKMYFYLEKSESTFINGILQFHAEFIFIKQEGKYWL